MLAPQGFVSKKDQKASKKFSIPANGGHPPQNPKAQKRQSNDLAIYF
jgi:hypothetical protein